MSRRHALVVEVAAVLVALSVALVMLGHATASGSAQWAEGAAVTVAVALGVGAFVVVLLLAEPAAGLPARARRGWQLLRERARQAAEVRRLRAERAARRHATRGRR